MKSEASPLCRAASRSRSRGFTLVELLVVMAIMAILIGVSVGPLFRALQRGRQTAGIQNAHSLGIAMISYATDHDQLYPDAKAGTAANVAQALLQGAYITDPRLFFLKGDSSGAAPYVGPIASAGTTITASNVSWDFLGNGGGGLNATTFPTLPLFWSTLNGQTPTNLNTANQDITASPSAQNPFQSNGLAIFYIDNSAQFVTSSVTNGVQSVTMVTGANNGGGQTGLKVLSGQ